MKLLTKSANELAMFVQKEVSEEQLNDVMKALSVRWVLKNIASDRADTLNSIKRNLVYRFLKEYARSIEILVEINLLKMKGQLK